MRTPARVRCFVLAACLAAVSTAARAQTVAVDPLTCWWRASTGAVHVGESFSLVLTCAVVETADVKVVPDQSPLDPSVMQLPPFEVTSGTHHPDLRAGDRRFFQYEYQMRIVGEDLFGKDVKLPDVRLSYRVQTRVAGGAAVEGREQLYILPTMFFRVASLVAADATDIRDATTETFGDVDARAFRANLLLTAASVLFVLAALGLVLALVRALGRRRGIRPAGARTVGDVTVLGGVRGELLDVARERQQAGWTPPLANRLAAALRIVGGYALSRPANQTVFPAGVPAAATAGAHHDGTLVVRAGLTGRRRLAVSSSVTPANLAQERGRLEAANGSGDVDRAQLLEDLERALTSSTLAQYGRLDTLDDRALDDALDIGSRAAERLRRAQAIRKVTRAWAR